ncbi:MAG: hypothetical protein SPF66_04395 [Bacteroidaceae bacterium]|nr:hypothetical protein [Bacteroidaceae bacterium]
MRRILLGALLITLFVSCGKSSEEKANALIEDDIKKVLYHPETYDPAETQVDSAFTPFDDPVFYEKTVQLCKLGMSIDECDRKMKNAKSSMSIWSGPYQSAFGRNEYQEAKNEYDENERNKKSIEAKVQKLATELKTMLENEQQFIGFKARHRYRANNNAGQTIFGEMKYLFDKSLSKIVTSYDMDCEEYKAVQIIYKQMLGEDVVLESEELDNSDFHK